MKDGLHPKTLIDVRHLLLPGLLAESTPEIELDIITDFTNSALLVKGYNVAQKESLGFAITKEEITSGNYKTRFMPNVKTLISQLKAAA